MMDFREKQLYHQIHPLKLATDISSAVLSLYCVWRHLIVLAVSIGFLPPLVASFALLRSSYDWRRLQASAFGQYVRRYMTPWVELLRLVTLVPMAYGAWMHEPLWIVVGVVILVVAWANGLLWRRA